MKKLADWTVTQIKTTFGLVVFFALAAALLLGAGCAFTNLFKPEPVVVPKVVAETVGLATEPDGPHKGDALVPAERVPSIMDEFHAKLTAAEKTAEDNRVKAAAATQAAVAKAAATGERAVKKTRARQDIELRQFVLTQGNELDTIAENVADETDRLTRVWHDADAKSASVVAEIQGKSADGDRLMKSAQATRDAAEAQRQGVLGTGKDLLVGAATAVGTGGTGALLPWAVAAATGIFGLKKAAEAKAANDSADDSDAQAEAATAAADAEAAKAKAKADALSGTVATFVKAVDTLPPEVKSVMKQVVASITTPQDEIHITEAKAALRT